MDYDKLEVERAKLTIKVEDAKSLVAKWMGQDTFSDPREDAVVARLMGAAPKPPPKQDILSKLKPKTQPAKPKPVQAEPEESDEEESRSSRKVKKRAVSVLDSYKKRKKSKR